MYSKPWKESEAEEFKLLCKRKSIYISMSVKRCWLGPALVSALCALAGIGALLLSGDKVQEVQAEQDQILEASSSTQSWAAPSHVSHDRAHHNTGSSRARNSALRRNSLLDNDQDNDGNYDGTVDSSVMLTVARFRLDNDQDHDGNYDGMADPLVVLLGVLFLFPLIGAKMLLPLYEPPKRGYVYCLVLQRPG